jgi:hypothetical protein
VDALLAKFDNDTSCDVVNDITSFLKQHPEHHDELFFAFSSHVFLHYPHHTVLHAALHARTSVSFLLNEACCLQPSDSVFQLRALVDTGAVHPILDEVRELDALQGPQLCDFFTSKHSPCAYLLSDFRVPQRFVTVLYVLVGHTTRQSLVVQLQPQDPLSVHVFPPSLWRVNPKLSRARQQALRRFNRAFVNAAVARPCLSF